MRNRVFKIFASNMENGGKMMNAPLRSPLSSGGVEMRESNSIKGCGLAVDFYGELHLFLGQVDESIILI